LRRTGYKEEKFLEKFPGKGKVRGPGGKFLLLWERMRDEEMIEEKRTGKEMQSVTNRAQLLQ
jgi:hypothetical protein